VPIEEEEDTYVTNYTAPSSRKERDLKKDEFYEQIQPSFLCTTHELIICHISFYIFINIFRHEILRLIKEGTKFGLCARKSVHTVAL
jgi:hypothetical protein